MLKYNVRVHERELIGCQHRKVVAAVAQVTYGLGILVDLSCQPDHLGRNVHADHLVEVLRERLTQSTNATTEIQRSIPIDLYTKCSQLVHEQGYFAPAG